MIDERGGPQDYIKGEHGFFEGARPKTAAQQWKAAPKVGDDVRPADLTGDESAAVTSWVTSYDRMHAMQAAMKAKDTTSPAGLDAVAFKSALLKSPKLQGMVMRGVQMPGASVKDAQRFWTEKIGQRIGMPNFASTTTVRQVAASYAEPVLMRIHGASARDITWKLAELGSAKFREAIIGPGNFTVTGVKLETVHDSFYEKDRTRQVVVVDVDRVVQP